MKQKNKKTVSIVTLSFHFHLKSFEIPLEKLLTYKYKHSRLKRPQEFIYYPLGFQIYMYMYP